MFKKQSLRCLLFSCIIASGNGAYAQSITPASDGLNTNVNQVGNQYNITGGTQAGTNLFYSLQKLGLSTGEIANFLSNPNVQNVLTRVTGGEASLINGLIQVTGGNSNLFILNPAGIVFGANASLNVPASFSATTATAIQVGNGWFGVNSSVDEVRALSGNVSGYAFTNTLPSGDSNPSGVLVNEGELKTKTGESVTLVGGMVVNTGTIATPAGKITIAATADNKFIKISNEGSLISLELPISDQQAVGNAPVLKGVDLPSLLTGKTAGTSNIKGELTAANIDILSDRYDTSQATLTAPNIQQGWNYVFIDTNVKNYQTLVNGTTGGSNVNVIDANQNGISKISQTLANVTGANSLHIVSEGDKGSFWVGKDFVNNDRLDLYANDFSAWKLALSPAAEVMLYACNLAGDVSGQALVQRIASFTGSPVAASTDRTGGAVSNANWNLEYSTSAVRSQTLFTAATQQNYENALATLTVTNNTDAAPNSLRDRLAAAASGDTIAFDPSVTLITLASTLGISQNLTINGGGTVTVSGGNTVRVFDIGGGTVNLNGLTITQGNALDGAGIIVRTGAALNLTNSNITNSVATSQGGAIFSLGTATIGNSTFSNNSALFGGAIRNEAGTATISNSTFSNNSATNEGGAISNVDIVTISNSTFANNSAPVGGAILSGAGTATITNSTFTGNSAVNLGGAIAAFDTSTTISNSTFSNNSADFGGAFRTQNGTATISNSTFNGNSTTSEGGAILALGQTDISNSTFASNSSFNGGAIFNLSTVTIGNSTFSGNSANFGGAINSNGVGVISTTVGNSILVGNTATNSGNEILNQNPFTFTGANIVGTNGISGINSSAGLTGTTPITPAGAASTVINTTLANNGGPTQTFALAAGSIAIDASSTAGGATPTTSDQRGIAANGIRDIGAFEVPPPPPPTPPTPTPPPLTPPVVTPITPTSTTTTTVNTKPNIDPNKETHYHDDKKGFSLSSFTPVAFLSTDDIELQRLDRFLIVIIELMNKDGGSLEIDTKDIWKDADISIFDQSINQDVIKIAIRRSIGKFIGNEYIDLVDINFEPKKDKKLILLKVRKSPKPAKFLKG